MMVAYAHSRAEAENMLAQQHRALRIMGASSAKMTHLGRLSRSANENAVVHLVTGH